MNEFVELMNEHAAPPIAGAAIGLFTYYQFIDERWPSVPIGDIVVPDIGILDPQADITPLESVLISRMLWIDQSSARFSFEGKKPLDFAGFIRHHKMERHFRKT